MAAVEIVQGVGGGLTEAGEESGGGLGQTARSTVQCLMGEGQQVRQPLSMRQGGRQGLVILGTGSNHGCCHGLGQVP